MGYRLRPSRRTAGWTLAAALAAALALLALAPQTLPGMSPQELDRALAQLSEGIGPPTYYLGNTADGLALDAIAIPPTEEGNVQFLYGPCQQSRVTLGDEGGCTNPLMVMTDPWNPIARTCQRLIPVLGVPTLIIDDGDLELFTGAVRVHIMEDSGKRGFAHAVAHALRPVGATTPPPRLPPPTAEVQEWVDSRCHR